MRWDELEGDFMNHNEQQQDQQEDTSYLNFDTLSLISKPRVINQFLIFFLRLMFLHI